MFSRFSLYLFPPSVVAFVLFCIMIDVPPLEGAENPQRSDQVRIGVLAKRGTWHCLQKWQGIANYLTQRLEGKKVSVLPLSFEEINAAVANERVDFIFVNPAMYVELESYYQVTRIATLCNMSLHHRCTKYGGVIFTRADSPIKTLLDLKNTHFAAVKENSFGGWLMALVQLGHVLSVPEDFAGIRFWGTHDRVVLAVLRGEADAGTVRTDTLERMQQEGTIRLDDFRILDAKPKGYDPKGFPFFLSTPLYPEWPMAKLRNTSDALAKKLVAALFAMGSENAGATVSCDCGWTIPLSYQSVHRLLKELRLGPYAEYGQVSFGEAAMQHWPPIVLACVLGVLLAAFALYSGWLNRRLQASQKRVEQELEARLEEERRRKNVENMVRHELRSPVISIYNALCLLEEVDCLQKSAGEILALAKGKAQKALTSIDLKRALDAIENGKFSPPDTEVDLLALVQEVIDDFGAMAQHKKTRWDLRLIQKDSGPVTSIKTNGDKVLYAVLFSNLLRNALEAAPPGSIIRIIFENSSQPVVRVCNPGAVPEEIRESFFERFTTAGKTGGTGLGTYIVKKIVESHGGSVSMRTSEAAGTEVRVVFPQYVEPGAA